MDRHKWLVLVLSLVLNVLAGCVTQQMDSSGKMQTTYSWPFGSWSKDPKHLPKADTEVAWGDFKVRDSQNNSKSTQDDKERELELARAAYQRALEIDPNNVSAYVGLGHVYCLLGDYHRALKNYDVALKKHPQEARLWFDLGMCQCQRKDFNAAIPSFEKALAVNPDNRSCATTLGLCLARAGRVDESLRLLARYLGEAKAHLQVARMLEHLHQPEQARTHLQQAVQQEPRLADSTQTQEMLTRLQPSAQLGPVVNVGYQAEERP
jgi:tetratricopeptide (TPR) repeat protein